LTAESGGYSRSGKFGLRLVGDLRDPGFDPMVGRLACMNIHHRDARTYPLGAEEIREISLVIGSWYRSLTGLLK
jgi:hypothetical protein